jgi:hypothetical protein
MKVKTYSALLALLVSSGYVHAQAPGTFTSITNSGNTTLGDATTDTTTVNGATTINGPTAAPVGSPPGTPIPSALTVGGATTVNGTLAVQPAVTSVTTTNTTPAAGAPTTIGGIVDNGAGPVIVNQTVLSNNTGREVVTGGGGARIATNGDATFAADSQDTTNVTYSRVVRFDVAQAGHTGPTLVGLPVPGTQRYFLLNSAGAPITPAFGTEALLDAFVLTTAPTALLALDPSIGATVTAPAGTGGNLIVEGNSTLGNAATDTTTVNGALVANNGIDATGDRITNLAAGTAATDATTLGQVNAADAAIRGEFAAADTALGNAVRSEFAAADTALGTAVRSEFAAADTIERNARTAADTAIRGEFAAADTALGTAVRSEFAAADTTERNARTAADTAIRGEFAAADTTERNARTAADTAIRGEFAAADTAVRSEFAAADTAIRGELASEVQVLDGRINETNANLANETSARIASDNRLQSNIDENTRGIAMVAAMTNTRVEAGKTHGVDFNMAQFQSETGFAFGYANRINENVQVHGSLASTTDFEESVVRVGVAVQW